MEDISYIARGEGNQRNFFFWPQALLSWVYLRLETNSNSFFGPVDWNSWYCCVVVIQRSCCYFVPLHLARSFSFVSVAIIEISEKVK